MNAAPSVSTPRRRRIWPWALGIFLAPYVFLGLAALSYLSLNTDAARLRNAMMAASDADWKKTVQFSVGRVTLSAVQTGLSFARDPKITEASKAMEAIKHASVGVYACTQHGAQLAPDFLVRADQAMLGHGWKRMIRVLNEKEKVLIYLSSNAKPGSPVDLCLAVMQEKEMVIVSTSIDFDRLAELIELKQGDSFMDKLRLAQR